MVAFVHENVENRMLNYIYRVITLPMYNRVIKFE